VAVSHCHPKGRVAEQLRNSNDIHAAFNQPRGERVPQIIESQILDTRILVCALERLFHILDGLSAFAVPENVLVACHFHLEPPARFLQSGIDGDTSNHAYLLVLTKPCCFFNNLFLVKNNFTLTIFSIN